jgi:chromosome segregation ATPase
MQTTTKEIDQQVARVKGEITDLRAELATKKEHIEALQRQRDSLRSSALRAKDQRATTSLQDARAALATAQLEADDLANEISTASSEVDALLLQRTEAVRAEAWAKFLDQAKQAVAEGQQIEKFLDDFILLIGPHRERLAQLTQLSREAGRERSYDTRHLWRRFNQRIRTVSPEYIARQDTAYDAPYPEILQRTFQTARRLAEAGREQAVNE